MWNYKDHSEIENVLWCKLRAIEWRGLPFFISQILLPIMIIFFSLIYVFSLFIIFNILWAMFLVKSKYINLQLSVFFMYVVKFAKWPLCFVFAIYFIFKANYLYSLITFLWPFLAGIFGGFISGLVSGLMDIKDFNSVIQYEFFRKLTLFNS